MHREGIKIRLFIAINFKEEVKDTLLDIQKQLKGYAEKGNFTRRENLHLTVVFIGETMNLEAVKNAMDKVSVDPFNITISGLGKFRRRGGDIYWLGIDKSDKLNNLYNQISSELYNLGFDIEKREYKPHLTLGREVILQRNFNEIEFNENLSPITMDISRISLMKSERINGKLTYTEIYFKEL
ncbi:MAG: RNA 2',3'-cyclic phosphodiesterase [Clostridiales bacterium]|nr:RNA 2',3'-cyclic phosphodiesterase [Clostridiales bacterium]